MYLTRERKGKDAELRFKTRISNRAYSETSLLVSISVFVVKIDG